MSAAAHSCFRWLDCCKPGMWLANLSLALGHHGQWHVHAHCVVDDFGTLVPVSFVGLTATGDLIRSAS